MTAPKTDPRDAILAWLGEAAPHEAECEAFIGPYPCDCALGKIRRALRAALDQHEPDADACTGSGVDPYPAEWPCSTVRAIADALGVAT